MDYSRKGLQSNTKLLADQVGGGKNQRNQRNDHKKLRA